MRWADVRARHRALALVRVLVGEAREVLDAREGALAVAALGALALLGRVVADEAPAGRLDRREHVRLGVVRVAPLEGHARVLHRGEPAGHGEGRRRWPRRRRQ